VHGAASAYDYFILPTLLFYWLRIINYIPILIYSFSYIFYIFLTNIILHFFSLILCIFNTFIHLRERWSLLLRWHRWLHSFFYGLWYIKFWWWPVKRIETTHFRIIKFMYMTENLYTYLLNVIFVMRYDYVSRRLQTVYSTRVNVLYTCQRYVDCNNKCLISQLPIISTAMIFI
jgi:hypothetical protein